MKKWAGVLAVMIAACLTFVGPIAAKTTALQVAATAAPQRVHGSDGREHLVYNLVVTNAFTAEANLSRLVIRGGGSKLLDVSGAKLAAHTRPLGSEAPTTSVPKASAVVIYVDVAMPRSAGRKVPGVLSHEISYKLPEDAPVKEIISSTKITRPILRVDRRRPVRIAPPLRGAGWLNANGCCDPALNHRSTMLTSNGAWVMPETFAIDYIQLADGRFYRGDGTKNSDWYGYGAGVHSVARGTVVWAESTRPDVPPFTNLPDNPSVNNPTQFGGNGVIVRIKRGVYAHYYHFQPGSVRVKVGQRVRTGQKLGLLGNSGNTQGAHLHFGLTDGPGSLDSNSLPFEIDRFRLQGIAAAGESPGELIVTGKPRGVTNSHPLLKTVSKFRTVPPR
ncbi:MAG: M23 family metallopeptidase [Solirubrobacterales bacterium]